MAASAAAAKASVKRKYARLSASQGGGQTPTRPLEPPVTASHWYATDHTICAKASDSMARYTPESRTQNQPNTSAPASATSGAMASAAGIGAPCSTDSAAA